jgi:hypothetical protein
MFFKVLSAVFDQVIDLIAIVLFCTSIAALGVAVTELRASSSCMEWPQ